MQEEDIYKYWKENDIFNKSILQNKSCEQYVFFDGPPFATGLPHYGHILAGLIKDTITRYHHNLGFDVPRHNGFDCISEGTLINLSDGTSLPIEQFINFYAKVETFNKEKNGICYEDSLCFFDQGEKNCVELTFQDGTKLTCTPEHKILTDKGWEKAQDIILNETKIIKTNLAVRRKFEKFIK